PISPSNERSITHTSKTRCPGPSWVAHPAFASPSKRRIPMITNAPVNQDHATHRSIQLGDEAPNFTAVTTAGELDFHHYLGDGWGILFSHPADFTPVCTTELGMVATLADEFARRNTKVIAISVDPLESHERWIADIEEVGRTRLNYPLIADPDRVVANLYG